jgi:hypothetical protein
MPTLVLLVEGIAGGFCHSLLGGVARVPGDNLGRVGGVGHDCRLEPVREAGSTGGNVVRQLADTLGFPGMPPGEVETKRGEIKRVAFAPRSRARQFPAGARILQPGEPACPRRRKWKRPDCLNNDCLNNRSARLSPCLPAGISVIPARCCRPPCLSRGIRASAAWCGRSRCRKWPGIFRRSRRRIGRRRSRRRRALSEFLWAGCRKSRGRRWWGDFGLDPGGRPFSSALNRIRANFTVFPQASCAAIFPAGGF